MSACLAVMGKQPERGKVKTRIAAALGDERALELYRCTLQDTLELALSIGDVAHVFSYAPPTEAARRYFKYAAPQFELIPQQGCGLGECIANTLASILQSHSPVVVIGSDSPDMPARLITRAFEILQTSDVVLGPAHDGGYYLIGVRSMQPVLFERIDWSTSVVAQQTRERAIEAGLRVVDLPPWHDLDTVNDLRSLVAPGAPLTRAFVAALNAKEVHENKSGGCLEGR
ncbi:MAG TPA: TIGR04282 family arsenosugar biosynthesis glycosyltransferase [Burkholderiaceae bacterium]|nr:TIGR04282 family arsenosugar biosynthesis glycosyltransferase [Burkholderiaceae bacterium]